MASKSPSLFKLHKDRESLVKALTAAVKTSWEGRYNDHDQYEKMAFEFAGHVADRRLDKLTYLTNGFNEGDKQLFSTLTGLRLPKANNVAYARLREWCVMPETLDELNAARASMTELRGSYYSVYPDSFYESDATITALIESGYTEIRKSRGAEYLCSKTDSAVYVLAGRAEAKNSLFGRYRDFIRAAIRVKAAEVRHDEFQSGVEEDRRQTKAVEMARRSALIADRPINQPFIASPSVYFL